MGRMRASVARATGNCLLRAAPRDGSLAGATMSRVAVPARQIGRLGLARLAIASLLAVTFLAVISIDAGGATLTVNGVTFSDRLGGFVLEKATGRGSLDDPFVLVERMTDPNGGTLSFRAPSSFGNPMHSPQPMGFALVKVIQNATGIPWTAFELELQSILGTPSDYYDGLSFGQGSQVGRPFTASGFSQVTVIDEPYDRVEYDHGRIPVGGSLTLRVVITEFDPLTEAYLLQRPSRPVASMPVKPGKRKLASRQQ